MTDFKHISKAAVIGAGSMGAGIAAHLANSGAEVVLLDIPADGDDRNARAKKGIENQIKQHGLMDEAFASRITPGNIEDDLDKLGDVEWIVEAVFEDPKVKHDTFAKINAHRAPGTPVSSNTSTLPLTVLTEGMDEDMVGDFAITHFFNPPRVMRLAELVRSEKTSDKTAETLTRILEQQLGKVVIDCRDTPGFIANRVGNLWMAAGAAIALRDGITPDLADAAFGRPFGVPRTGIFGLFDFVGIQIMPSIWGSLLKALPENDAYHDYNITESDVFKGLLERGWTGRTGPGGFYREKGKEVLDVDSFEYRPRKNAGDFDDAALSEKKARDLMGHDTPAGNYAREVFLVTLRYCAETAPEIADTVEPIDHAMALGYGWKKGPFALADDIGLDWIVEQYGDDVPELVTKAKAAGGFYPSADQVLSTSGEVVPAADREGVVTVAEIAKDAEVIIDEEAAVVYRLPEGIAVYSFRTPMNNCSPAALDVFKKVTERDDITGLLIANDEERAFCAGADLKVIASLSKAKDEKGIEEIIRKGRETFGALRSAPFPVVGAARGSALGGGMELILHLDAVVAHAELRVGFPERQVGLFPAWGGPLRLLERTVAAGVDNPHKQAYDFLLSAQVIPGAFLAQDYGLLVKGRDEILLSPDHVVAEALEVVRELAKDYQAPQNKDLPLYPADAEALAYTQGSDVDAEIGAALARVYTAQDGDGESLSVEEMGKRETAQACGLLIQDPNADRAEHMAKTRKPLKN